ncbi:hypothetical protein [Mucilaginibacter endophyticus]|uniref:hypothetical protein n=1 Tax=Mucilaginibacter endophyticus TaxID=2675003 RepID=UPI000E0D25A3|nr:hypothetical protein [Mucilaginibacter endophyticus]
MNKYLIFLTMAIFCLLNSCKKDDNNGKETTVIAGVTIQSVSYPAIANSTWVNVTGGTASLRFDLLGADSKVTSTLNDSVRLNNVSSFDKTLSEGTYNIYIASKNVSAAADTFIRFNAQVKSYQVKSKQALSFNASSDDGLITIGKSFVQDNTFPVFKSDTGTRIYKFGLVNGFYYLYVKGGIKGSVSFNSKLGQTFSKQLTISSLTQYNLALQNINASMQIVFEPFIYNPIGVRTSTLLTMNINPDALAGSKSVYFVVTDENGVILNEVKYINGTSVFKISSLQPYEKDRFNFFQIRVSNDPNTMPQIIGYLQIKKGSVYTTNWPFLPQKPTSAIKPHVKNTTGFDALTVSSDFAGATIRSLADTSVFQSLRYVDGGKLFVQMLKGNQQLYKFFDIPNSTLNFDIDVTKLTETPKVQSITAPGDNLRVMVMGKTDINYSNLYYLLNESSQAKQMDIYYPTETFPEYDAMMSYDIGNLTYSIVTRGPKIPDNAAGFNASFNVDASSLANFKPSWSGTFDYYMADFIDPSSSYLNVVLYSPLAGNYKNIKLPDFAKYLGFTQLDLNTLRLKSFGLYQYDGFDETQFLYKYGGAFFGEFNGKQVVRNY